MAAMSSGVRIPPSPHLIIRKNVIVAKSTKKPEIPKSEKSKNPIQSNLNEFLEDLQRLRSTLPILSEMLRERVVVQLDDLKSFKDEAHENDSIKRLEVHSTLLKRLKAIRSTLVADGTTTKSYFVSMISLYDGYLVEFLNVVLQKRPEILNSADKTRTIADILASSSIESLRREIISEEIDDVMHKSHAEQIFWLEKTFNVKIQKQISKWADFIELTERRNLLVHTDGRVSSKYISVCSRHQVDISKVKKDQKLGVDKEYFEMAFAVMFEVAAKLTHLVWRKIFPEDQDCSNDNFNNDICYLLLKNEEYKLAINLLNFATTLFKKNSNDTEWRMYIINQSIAYKWMGNNAKAQEILDTEDWTATNSKFQLAVAVLRENNKLASKLVGQMDWDYVLAARLYSEWPLFNKFRETKLFQSAFQTKYEHPFSEINIKEVQKVRQQVKQSQKKVDK